MRNDRVYLLYDERACGGCGNTDDAVVLLVCGNKEEARQANSVHETHACYSYRLIDGIAEHERWEWDHYAGDHR